MDTSASHYLTSILMVFYHRLFRDLSMQDKGKVKLYLCIF